jgi:hypothetical protein
MIVATPPAKSVVSLIAKSRRQNAMLASLASSPRHSPSPSPVPPEPGGEHPDDLVVDRVSALCFVELPQAQAGVDELQKRADVADDELHAQQIRLQQQASHYRHTMRAFQVSTFLQDEAERTLKEAELGWWQLRKSRAALDLRLNRAAEKLEKLHAEKRALLADAPSRVRVSLAFLQCMQQLQRREIAAQQHSAALDEVQALKEQQLETERRLAALLTASEEGLRSSGKLANRLGDVSEDIIWQRHRAQQHLLLHEEEPPPPEAEQPSRVARYSQYAENLAAEVRDLIYS